MLAYNEDVEKQPIPDAGSNMPEMGEGEEVSANRRWAASRAFLIKAAAFGRVEFRGIAPIPIKERTVESTVDVFTLWWSMNTNILPITFGMLGPVYGLGLRDSSLVILFFTLLTALLPAYLSTLGPKIGMRQMIQARYSFGRYLVSVPVLLNLATLTGFSVIIAVVGGQCLSAVAGGSLSVDVGIVIIALLALVISFCGFTVLHVYERFAWIPALVAIVVAVGTGGSGLRQQTVVEEPAAAPAVLSFGMIVASYMIPWACLASDFTTYLSPMTSSAKIFWYSYLGTSIPTILLMVLGAAIGGAVENVPEWADGYASTSVGGVLAAMLAPAVGFGKFLVVLLSLSLLGNLAATAYSVTLNFQMLLPQNMVARVPRYAFALVLTAIVVPVSIRAAADFFVSLENFVALIGYWSSAFLGVVLVEHLLFRRGDCASYDADAWDKARLLPWGAAALAAAALSFALVIPAMDQTWYHGPIASTTGDIGFELAFAVSAALYVPLRFLEKKFVGR
ncbi:permease for cytosine/purines, uracil, thiamine, allantoin-domain-containing protein [Lasiosphaeria miniovina]|uniref:Permease for cytosine/purines, uracil, thiamine, allantoin-domain-containing protein n=1 Tax=Lasiosphaeria miniovina TaxID=1954250 RepID=A0AA40B6C8_9PEZI|nr:permease for cytosine/purines, uracil, thiamine, allantoin-domain-containing protein [Lasiosphaeria miniovina]KAK0728372.1 permease for cytosine/purines, uracil, thiamine, allantoin-domain-containing protein [Lasiosphaeria miniovina]